MVCMACLANLVGFGLVYAYGVFFKPVCYEFGWSRSVTVGPFSFYAIFHSILAFFAGKFCDRFGPKLILVIGGFCIGFSMILMSYANSLWELYLSYGFFLSIGIAAMYIPCTATVSRWFKERRGLAMGLAAAGLGAGSLVFSPLSVWLISTFGWRKAYSVIGILAWIVFIPIVKFIKQVPRERIELELSEGLSFSQAFMTGTFWAYSLAWFFVGAALWSVMIHIVPLATDRGVSMVTAGILAGLIGVGGIIGRISAGFLSDKIGRKRILITEFTLQLISFVWLLFSKETWMLFFFAIFFGLSSGGWTGVITALAGDYFGSKATGTILGFIMIVVGIGIAIGPYVGGYIFDATQSYDYMVVMCIIATVSAIISASFLRPIKKR